MNDFGENPSFNMLGEMREGTFFQFRNAARMGVLTCSLSGNGDEIQCSIEFECERKCSAFFEKTGPYPSASHLLFIIIIENFKRE